MAARVFISFDYDNDRDVKELLVGQAKNPDSPFDITDASVKYHLTGDWQEKVRGRIKRADQVIVLCGKNTGSAPGVTLEVKIARDLRKPYFLLAGRAGDSVKPKGTLPTDKVYTWTWANLKTLIKGGR